MNKLYNGYCEEQQKEYQVSREYINTGEIASSSTFIKGRLNCKHDGLYGCKYYDKYGKCSVEENEKCQGA